MNYYTYAFLREDGTPYYIGKGKGYRCYRKTGRRTPPPKDRSRIIKLKENLTEEEAYRHEIYLIAVLPNLRNQTPGGEGRSGFVWSEEHKRSMSECMKSMNLGYRGGHPPIGSSPSQETRDKISATLKANKNRHYIDTKGKVWVNNGETRKLVYPDQIPEGWVRGKKL